MMTERAPRPPDKKPNQTSHDLSSPADPEMLRAELAMVRGQLEEFEREWAHRAERERALRNETRHRVRNMLAIIRSICSRTFGPDVQEIGDHFRGRLDALARFEIGRGDHLGTCDLEEMVRDELRSFEFDSQIDIAGPEVAIPTDIARLLGLALHELATNSIKFGVLSANDDRAHLAIGWTRANDLLTLHWKETGISVIAAAPMETGFGREFIEQALPYQISATTSFELRPGGLVCTIALPLPGSEAGSLPPRPWI